MSDDPIETAELLAFTRTVDARSLSRAASELGVPRATVGRRLQRLEQRLGVRLLRRTTRSLTLTDAGEALYRQARIALDAVRDAELSVRRTDDVVRGDLRVSAPPITTDSFYRLLSDFAARYPEVRLHVHLTTQYVDIQRGGYDVAIRGARALEPGLVARVLVRGTLMAAASPEYLAAHGAPRTLRDLRAHHCLLGFARGELPQTHWSDRKGRSVRVEGRIASNDIVFLCQAALAGLGIVVLPAEQLRPYVDQGKLVQVLENTIGGETRMTIVYAEREFLPAQVRAFVDAVTVWARDNPADLWPAPPRESAQRARAAETRTSTPRTSSRSDATRRA